MARRRADACYENWVRNSESGGSPRTSLTPRAVEHGSGNTETALADPDIVNGKVDARDRIVDGLDSTREVRQVPVCRTELLTSSRLQP